MDWAEIADLYSALLSIHDTPVIRLNRAVAVALAEGPDVGLHLIERLDADLAEFHPLHAARADLLRRAEAAAAYARRAIALCANVVERRYLERRLAEVSCVPRLQNLRTDSPGLAVGRHHDVAGAESLLLDSEPV